MNGSPESKSLPCVPLVIRPTGINPGQEKVKAKWLVRAPLIVTLYGLFDLSGHCLYVGQSAEPKRRKRIHWNSHGLWFKVLRKCESAHADRLERQIIAAYRKKSQATQNKLQGGSSVNKPRGKIFVCEDLNLFFVGVAHASQFFGWCTAVIYSSLKYGHISASEDVWTLYSFYELDPMSTPSSHDQSGCNRKLGGKN